ncbi:MAG: hypothetical protein OXG64_00770 [Chloroflexi bacterium]|nr:hypothetical protein [Chloroflexota bacterium]
MTLIVGIWTSEGVVLGADSAATSMLPDGRHTVLQYYPDKINLIGDTVAVASTGAVGFQQRFVDKVAGLANARKLGQRRDLDAGRLISNSIVQDFQHTRAQSGEYGALVALPVKGGPPALIEFDARTLQPEVKTSSCWYVSMGSGQTVADPLLGFAREAFWGNKPPSKEGAIFCTMFVMSLSCKMCPSGVREPIQIAVVEPANGKVLARFLTDDQLREHRQHVNDVVSRISSLTKYDQPKVKPPMPSTDRRIDTVQKP